MSHSNTITYSVLIISVLYTILSLVLKINFIEYNKKLDILNFSEQELYTQVFIICFDIIKDTYSNSIILIVIFSFYSVFKQIETIENTINYINNMSVINKTDRLSFYVNKLYK